jgi:tetracycline resistance efflux pump
LLSCHLHSLPPSRFPHEWFELGRGFCQNFGMSNSVSKRTFGFLVLMFLAVAALGQTRWGVRALVPSVVALLGVLILKRALAGLLLGAAAGCLLLAGGNPWNAIRAFFSDHLLPSLKNEWNLSVLIFTLLLGGFAALIERGGGFRAMFEKWMAGQADRRRRVQASAFGMGLICFFDGLANSMMVGKSIGPLAQRCGVSREKMAYIVDSTSSAVACIAVISTWIAYQLSMIREGYKQAGVETVNAFEIFLRSIPLNFYCWFTLMLLALVIWRSWNIGPMAAAEASASDAAVGNAEATEGNSDARGWQALLPLSALMLTLIGSLYYLGAEKPHPFTFAKAWSAFGAAPANLALLYASAVACVVAVLVNFRVIGRTASCGEVFMDGVVKLFPPCLILIAAWTLSSTSSSLGAAQFLTQILTSHLSAGLFPALVFVVGLLISFTTGTSWGTMGILMPLAIPVAVGMNPAEGNLVSAVVAAVFSGAVFGDHCSPFSDTTIVSSLSCDLEPTRHVVTQLPYALIAAGLALLVGFLPAGFGVPGILCLAVGGIVIICLPRIWPGASSAAGKSASN